MRLVFAFALLLAPAQVLASCEGLLSVHSRELAFTYIEATSDDGEAWTPAYRRQVYGSLAHALAVAQHAFEYARTHSPEASPGAASRVLLLPHGKLAPEDLDDSAASFIAREGSRADFDSVCVLWTIEIARLRTEDSARELAREADSDFEDSADYVRSGDAVVYYETCAGTWEPGTFVIHASGVAPWSVRRGLYLTREDAERAAKKWSQRARVVRQRVDGALLEQALSEPEDGC